MSSRFTYYLPFMVDLNKIVSAGVGPIIVISACGLLSSAFYNRMTNVITRLRAFQRERLAEQLASDRETDPATRARRMEMLAVLATQTDSLMRRVRLIRRTLFCLLLTICSLVICSLTLGLSVLYPPAIYAAVFFFTLGLLILLAGLIYAMIDLNLSIDPVILETSYVTRRLSAAERI